MSEVSCPGCAQRDAVIEALRKRVDELERLVKDLQQRLGANASNSSLPPSANPPQAPAPVVKKRTGRKTGGQPGHKGHQRPPTPPPPPAPAPPPPPPPPPPPGGRPPPLPPAPPGGAPRRGSATFPPPPQGPGGCPGFPGPPPPPPTAGGTSPVSPPPPR